MPAECETKTNATTAAGYVYVDQNSFRPIRDQNMMRSESLTKLIPALILAKTHFAPALKDKVNPAFRSGYVSLDGVLDATEDHLMNQGLVVVQTTDVDPTANGIFLVTTLYHDSGEFICSRYVLWPAKADPQGYGSAMTYARRYCLMAILGIAPEDDDGNAAAGAKPVTFKAAKGEPPPAPIPLPEKSSVEINNARVAAGQEPIVDTLEKTAAAASYKILRTLDKDWAAAIKHEAGTDYRKMKTDLDKAIAMVKERNANVVQPQ